MFRQKLCLHQDHYLREIFEFTCINYQFTKWVDDWLKMHTLKSLRGRVQQIDNCLTISARMMHVIRETRRLKNLGVSYIPGYYQIFQYLMQCVIGLQDKERTRQLFSLFLHLFPSLHLLFFLHLLSPYDIITNFFKISKKSHIQIGNLGTVNKAVLSKRVGFPQVVNLITEALNK